MEKKETENNIPSIAEISRRLYCPLENLEEEDDAVTPEASLSHIPWVLKQQQPQLKEFSNASATLDGNLYKAANGCSFPEFSYLDLRRRQNTAWANDRLQEGNELFFSDPGKAESLFKQGLDLVPDHVDLLVGYAKFLAQTTKRRPLAIQKLERALEIDPNHEPAKEQLTRVQMQLQALLRRQKQQNNIVPAVRESSVFQDVLMERSLASDSLPASQPDFGQGETENASNSSKSHERHQKESSSRKHHHKKHHKKRRKRTYSSSSSSSSDDEASSESYSKRKKRRKRKNRHHDSSYSSSEEDEERKRRRRKHRRHRRRKRASKQKERNREEQEHNNENHS